MTDVEERSAEACPVCGAHQLTVLDFPSVHGGFRPAVSDGLGVRVTDDSSEPSIGCLACGAEWPDLASFREARDGLPDGALAAERGAGDETRPDTPSEDNTGLEDVAAADGEADTADRPAGSA